MLSRSDADYLRRYFPGATSEGQGAAPLHVLLPALRSDMAALPPPAEGTQQQEASAQPTQAQAGTHDVAAATAAGAASADGQQLGTRGVGSAPQGAHSRRYLTCCVRLSAEKEPHRFVDLVLELQASPWCAGPCDAFAGPAEPGGDPAGLVGFLLLQSQARRGFLLTLPAACTPPCSVAAFWSGWALCHSWRARAGRHLMAVSSVAASRQERPRWTVDEGDQGACCWAEGGFSKPQQMSRQAFGASSPAGCSRAGTSARCLALVAPPRLSSRACLCCCSACICRPALLCLCPAPSCRHRLRSACNLRPAVRDTRSVPGAV